MADVDDVAVRTLSVSLGDMARLIATSARRCPAGDRDDLVQDLWLFVLVRGPGLVAGFQARGTLEAYLASALFNRTTDWLRARGRRTHRRASDADLDHATNLEAPVGEHTTDEARLAALDRALAALAPDARAFILDVASATGGMAEVAPRWGLTRAAAYSRYHRLLRHLRTTLTARADPIRSDPIRSGWLVTLAPRGRIASWAPFDVRVPRSERCRS